MTTIIASMPISAGKGTTPRVAKRLGYITWTRARCTERLRKACATAIDLRMEPCGVALAIG